MPHLICYDISNNSLRTKLGKTIISFGLDRINKSVYLGTITERSLTLLETKCRLWITKQNHPDDSLIIIRVAPAQIHEMKVLGKNDLDRDELNGDKAVVIIQD